MRPYVHMADGAADLVGKRPLARIVGLTPGTISVGCLPGPIGAMRGPRSMKPRDIVEKNKR